MTSIWIGWTVFAAAFVWSHLRVRGERGGGPARERRVGRDRSSDWGLALQGIAVLIAFAASGPVRWQWMPLAWLIQGLSVGLAFWCLRTLGRQWRLQAVVTEDHELVTNGPYRWIRHPIYLALLGMVAATLLAHGRLTYTLPALVLYLTGTEIRIRAEDRLLIQQFGNSARDYQKRTAAYLPWVR